MSPMYQKRSLSLQLDPRSNLPAFEQVARHIEVQAASGRLHPGDQLPTVRDLAAQLGINFNTVARAYRSLQQTGVVSPKQGRGTFVLARPAASSESRARRLTLAALARRYIQDAQHYRFTSAQIESALRRELNALS